MLFTSVRQAITTRKKKVNKCAYASNLAHKDWPKVVMGIVIAYNPKE